MAEEVADEVESRRVKRQCPGGPSRGYHLDGDDEGDGEGDDEEDGNDGIWCAWKKLFKNLKESIALPPLSPECHDIIWCGRQVHRRPMYPIQLYSQLNNELATITLQPVDPCFHTSLSQVVDAADGETFSNAVQIFRSRGTALMQKQTLISKSS
ncbi:uncharacterized protein BYT42DRAFT_192942 [Radiomyces spectabilis]|uniref:uncharacterized protein n=1 Tax=Radiomyces spectabilis TaxID=64574 RepID=UPI002220048C|nr:uncharacterized protein BYT42DRAFT_192942 [Radiomyces spectabilis]KAI8391398.1 hypothetical protein BYT42DRAFT_192942 [Radiomyces spectabilis]